ncbi:MAG: hypothetical protein ABSC94_21765 [Polyangiaceae bacterium]|jgi:hypothetical protein
MATEIVNRTRGELLADGFRVEFVDPIAEADRVTTLTRVGTLAGVAVAAGLFVDGDTGPIELLLVDEVSGRVMSRRLDLRDSHPDGSPAILARRSVDLLRANLLDFLVESLRTMAAKVAAPPAAPPPPAPARAELRGPQPAGTRRRWGLEAGVAALSSFDAIAPSISPIARVRWAASPLVQIRATGSWLGTAAQGLTSSNGAVTVRQGLALLELLADLDTKTWIHPCVSTGAGLYSIETNGSGVSANGYAGKQASQVAAIADLGFGTVAWVSPHFEMVLEADVLFADPAIKVRLVDMTAQLGRPSFLFALTLAGWI